MHKDFDEYSDIKSCIHSWDPRFKIVFFLILIFSISSLTNLKASGLAFIMTIIILFMSKIPKWHFIKNIRYPVLFMLPVFLTLPFTSHGAVLYKNSYITLYRDGIILSALICIKCISIIVLFMIVLRSTAFKEISMALYALKIPEKLVSMILFVYRYIYVYLEDLRKMKIALTLRGFKTKNNIHTLKSLSNIVGSLLVRSYEQTERIYSAMCLRGFSGKIYMYREFNSNGFDIFKSLLFTAGAVCLIIFDRMIYL